MQPEEWAEANPNETTSEDKICSDQHGTATAGAPTTHSFYQTRFVVWVSLRSDRVAGHPASSSIALGFPANPAGALGPLHKQRCPTTSTIFFTNNRESRQPEDRFMPIQSQKQKEKGGRGKRQSELKCKV